MEKVRDILDLPLLIQYKYFHNPLNERNEATETKELRRCYELLDMTSRSFSAVIKELEGDLRACIAIFYLVLRGLDTVEDDMTLDVKFKVEELRTFYEKLRQPGWTFDKSGPDEKDRQLLVEFDVVITEFEKLRPEFQEVIKDICDKMGNGMADYIVNADHNKYGVVTLKDFDLYCHYVAGLVGEGLSRLFGVSGYEKPELASQMELSNHMGLFLQKTNIIRDYAEDLNDDRKFWPKEIWGLYATDLSDLQQEIKAGKTDNALACINHLVLNVLAHAPYVLDYLCQLRNQSVFNFCAIPQVMAIATLELVFNNPDVFLKNVKIRKGLAVRLITAATNPIAVAYTFQEFAHKIHARLSPADPNFIALSVALARIDQWVQAKGFTPAQVAHRVALRQQGKRIAADGSIVDITDEKSISSMQKRAEDKKFSADMRNVVIVFMFFFVMVALILSVLLRWGTYGQDRQGRWF